MIPLDTSIQGNMDGGCDTTETQGIYVRYQFALIVPSNQSLGLQFLQRPHLKIPEISEYEETVLEVMFICRLAPLTFYL